MSFISAAAVAIKTDNTACPRDCPKTTKTANCRKMPLLQNHPCSSTDLQHPLILSTARILKLSSWILPTLKFTRNCRLIIILSVNQSICSAASQPRHPTAPFFLASVFPPFPRPFSRMAPSHIRFFWREWQRRRHRMPALQVYRPKMASPKSSRITPLVPQRRLWPKRPHPLDGANIAP